MELVVDISRAVNEGAGIARYIRRLMPPLVALAQKEHLPTHLFTTYLRGDDRKQQLLAEYFEPEAQHVDRYRLPGTIKEWLWSTPFSLPDYWYPQSSLLFAPSFFELPLGTNKRAVVTIHDLTAALFPKQRGEAISRRLAARSAAAAAKATRVITISEQTKRDVLGCMEIEAHKIIVISLAADPIFQVRPDIAKEPIILAVGTLEPRKNFARVIAAYRQLSPGLRAKYRLVIIGGRGWNDFPVIEALKGDLEGSVEWLGYLTDQELATWYNRASLFVYPSLYEGFGLPPLEAMQSGTAVITSQTSSLPEVVGTAALTIDPHSTEEIREAMMRLLSNPQRRHHLEAAGPLRAAQFSWGKTAEQTLEVLLGAAHDTI